MQFHKYKTVDHLSFSSSALLLIVIVIMVKNSSSVKFYMVIILLDTKVTVNQPITKYINQKTDNNVLFLMQCLKHVFPWIFLAHKK